MKAKVLKSECIGCGMCVGSRPDIFRFSDAGCSEVYTEIDPADKDEVQNIMNLCPMGAIGWEK